VGPVVETTVAPKGPTSMTFHVTVSVALSGVGPGTIPGTAGSSRLNG
jgi:hypothetical protein